MEGHCEQNMKGAVRQPLGVGMRKVRRLHCMGGHGWGRSLAVLLKNGAGNSIGRSTDIASTRCDQSQHQINHADSQKPMCLCPSLE